MQHLRKYKREFLLTLVGLTVLNLLLWPFKTQSALFLAVFLTFPLWFIYVFLFVEEEKPQSQQPQQGTQPQNK